MKLGKDTVRSRGKGGSQEYRRRKKGEYDKLHCMCLKLSTTNHKKALESSSWFSAVTTRWQEWTTKMNRPLAAGKKKNNKKIPVFISPSLPQLLQAHSLTLPLHAPRCPCVYRCNFEKPYLLL